jgi:SAM-dependent methyltransferase
MKEIIVNFLKSYSFLNVIYKLQRNIRYDLGLANNYPYQEFLKGDGIEVGAMSAPAFIRHAKSIRIADIDCAENQQLKAQNLELGGLYRGYFPKVDIIIPRNDRPLKSVEDSSVDFVFSSHSLEHAPNPICSLIDYYRVVKDEGIVYSIIPNKHNTYDRKRKDTPISELIHKWKNNIFEYKLSEFEELYQNTIDHPVYENKSSEEIRKAFLENSGMHHIAVYSIENTLQMIQVVLEECKNSKLIFLKNDWDIHFAIKKNPPAQYGQTLAEKKIFKENKNV